MSKRKQILFLTNSEYGQANVVLAVAHSLVHIATDATVHIASFAPLANGVRATSKHAVETAPVPAKASPIVFHQINGPPYIRTPVVNEMFDLKPGLINTSRVLLRGVPEAMMPWEPEGFGVVCTEVERILDEVRPDLTIIEPLFGPGLTICNRRGGNWIVLAPNTIKDFAVPVQPGLAALWKYPLVCTGLPFPLPWHKIPYNIALSLVAAYMILTNKRSPSIAAHLRERLGSDVQLITANELGVLRAPPAGVRILTANSPELDFPFARLPEYTVPCGPIVRVSKPLADVDPELLAWLNRGGPTVYVNLGTYLTATPEQAADFAGALQDLLVAADKAGFNHGSGKLRVLWKLGRAGPAGGDGRPAQKSEQDWTGPWKKVVDLLGPEMETDRVRITGWFTAEPKSILESKHIVCSVHHGGASSFNESLCSGIPQVVLPPWADCFDFGSRAELLGIGVWGNKQSMPRWERAELASALKEVVLGPRSEAMSSRAAELASKYPEAAGRECAAREILASLHTSE